MKEIKYIIKKQGREISNIYRAGNVTVLDAALGVAYSEPEKSFSAYLDELKNQGYNIEKIILS